MIFFTRFNIAYIKMVTLECIVFFISRFKILEN